MEGDDEYLTPGNDMGSILKEFIDKNSKQFDKVLIDENSIKNDAQLTDFKVLSKGKLFNAKLIVLDNMMLGYHTQDQSYKPQIFEGAMI